MPDFSNVKASDFWGDGFLATAYRCMSYHEMTFIKDKNGQGPSEYIDLAERVFRGMPEDIKKQYKDLLALVIEKRQIRIGEPNFWQRLRGANPTAVDENLGNEIDGVFKVISNVVSEAQKVRSQNGKDWFNITEEEIKNAMGIDNLDDILSAVYYPRNEKVQRFFDEARNDKFSSFGTNPLIAEETKNHAK